MLVSKDVPEFKSHFTSQGRSVWQLINHLVCIECLHHHRHRLYLSNYSSCGKLSWRLPCFSDGLPPFILAKLFQGTYRRPQDFLLPRLKREPEIWKRETNRCLDEATAKSHRSAIEMFFRPPTIPIQKHRRTW